MTTPAENTSQAQPSACGNSACTDAEAGSRAGQAHKVVRRSVYWALGMGLIPIPVVDFVALTGVQVKMLKEISALYNVDFLEDKAKTVVGSLIAGLGGLTIAGAVARSLFKFMPLVGQLVGMVGGSLLGGALTLAVGNLFMMHYESGGTLLDFDANKLREHFRAEFEKARASVRQMQMEPKNSASDSVTP